MSDGRKIDERQCLQDKDPLPNTGGGELDEAGRASKTERIAALVSDLKAEGKAPGHAARRAREAAKLLEDAYL